MVRNLLIIIVMISITFGCKKDPSSVIVNPQLLGQWNLDSTVTNLSDGPFLKIYSDCYWDFNKDGNIYTYQKVINNGISSTSMGTITYSANINEAESTLTLESNTFKISDLGGTDTKDTTIIFQDGHRTIFTMNDSHLIFSSMNQATPYETWYFTKRD